MSSTAEEELKGIIRNDEKMWIEYGEKDFVAKEVTYHAKCKHEYILYPSAIVFRGAMLAGRVDHRAGNSTRPVNSQPAL